MANRVKGIVVEIGGNTTKLNKALEGTNKQIGKTQTSLKDVERLLKLDPTNTELLSQKQRLLAEAVSDTKEKLDVLKKAEKQVQEQFAEGEVSQEIYDDLQREIIATEQQLRKFEQRAKETDDAIADISSEPIDDIRQAADRAEEELHSMATAAQTVKDKAAGIADTFQPVTTAVSGLAAAAVATVPATEELRDDLSKLDANAENSAASVDAAREAWKEFAIQSGETDSAVEAVSNLLQANFTESNLQKAVEGLAGAALQFPDTLKIESLADSLQETLASGSATGQFSELLSRLGMDAEAFSEQLASCATEAEKQDFVLQTLADAGLNSAYNAWKNNNAEMLANKEANLELEQSMAEMAEVVLPIVTKVTNAMADFISWFANLSPTSQTAIVSILAVIGAIAPMSKAISGAAGIVDKLSKVNLPSMGAAFGKITDTVLPGIQGAFSSVFGFIAANPVVLLIAAIVGLVALVATKGDEMQALLQKFDTWLQGVFATDWTNIFGPVLGGALNIFFSVVKTIWDSVKQIFNGIIDFIRGVFTGDWERAWSGVVSIFSGVFSGLKSIAKTPINSIISLVNGAISGINSVITKINKIPGVNIGTIGKIPMLASGGTVYSGDAIVGENGPELLTVSGGKAVVRPLSNSNTTNNTANFGNTTVNVYAREGQDVHEIAEEVVDILGNDVARKAAIFGA